MNEKDWNTRPNCTIKIKKTVTNHPPLADAVISGFVSIKLSGVSDEQIRQIVTIAEEMCK